MAEYIERKALLEKLCSEYQFEELLYPENDWFNRGLKCAIRDVKKQPKADVVEVVRCKDCSVPHNNWTGCPHLNGLIPPPDFYCGSGKRKEGGNNG